MSLDHRELGLALGYFSFHEEGPGLPFFHHKGNLLKEALISFWRREHYKAGYEEISSPILLDADLWRRSGHLEYFAANMFFSSVEKRDYAIKPMSCPGAMLNYLEKKRSFRELPLRLCELGLVHRNENSGSLHGLLRVRSFVQDDAHIFCARGQVSEEIKGVLALFERILKRCGFSAYKIELSLRGPEKKYLGEDADWEMAQGYLEEALKDYGWDYEKKEGEAKFYGPSLDLHIQDRKGRYWQCSTLQFDFNLPRRFNVHYFDEHGERQVPIMLHRAVFGSLERFIGILLESYQGELPLWLAPVQVRIAALRPELEADARALHHELWDRGIRAELELRSDHVNEKILRSRKDLVPVLVLFGEKERESGQLALRGLRGERAQMPLEDLVKCIRDRNRFFD